MRLSSANQGFRPILQWAELYEKLIKNDIAVYISHTNLDVAEGGMNDWMAEALGIEDGAPIKDIHTEQLSKLVVFVPKDHHQKVQDAILNAGAGQIGNYSHCSFNMKGIAPSCRRSTDPFQGAGKLGVPKSVLKHCAAAHPEQVVQAC
jgi:hypothetical protein